MKRMAFIVAAAALLAACTSRTEHGECIGLADEKKPDLQYRVSTWNVVMGVIFIETIVVPVVVAIDQVYCPVGRTNASPL